MFNTSAKFEINPNRVSNSTYYKIIEKAFDGQADEFASELKEGSLSR